MSDPKEIKAEEFFKGMEKLPAKTKSMLRELAAVSSHLAVVTPKGIQQNVRIPLKHFEFFAPYFLDLVRPPTAQVASPDQLASMWAGCVGLPQFDADVFDDRPHSPTYNKVLFTVPSLYETEVLNRNPVELKGHTVGRLHRMQEAERNFSEIGDAIFIEGMEERVLSNLREVPDAIRKERAEAWAKIYVFFNVDIKDTIGYKEGKDLKRAKPLVEGEEEREPSEQDELDEFGGFN